MDFILQIPAFFVGLITGLFEQITGIVGGLFGLFGA